MPPDDPPRTPSLAARRQRRPVVLWRQIVQHATMPNRLRAFVRSSEFWFVVLAGVVGGLAGLMVAGMGGLAQALHALLFQLSPGERLSGIPAIERGPQVLIPALGGLLLGLFAFTVSRRRPTRPVDPIEANALHGGRMSLADSVIVALEIMISNGFGASVGLEAGYTQIAAGLGSRFGTAFRLRRSDLRVLVGCGASGAIAAAFGAPLTGAFYAFELIIGTYSIATLAPVMAASIVGFLIARWVGADGEVVQLASHIPVGRAGFTTLMILALLCGFLGILLMQTVTRVEALFRRTRIPALLRPGIGGLIVGCLALVNGHVLSSGHQALSIVLDPETPALAAIAQLLLLKALASAISLGSGFRGGLFFASLLLGALIGQLSAGLVLMIAPGLSLDPLTAAIVGMSALAVAVVGGPLTMAFLALETTGDYAIAVEILAAAAFSALVVRQLFGYSFSTWRLHLRGETIRSAHDIGWIRNLTVGRLMRRDVRTVRSDTRLTAFRRDFPLGSTQRVVVVDEGERYAGIVLVAEAHQEQPNEQTAPPTIAGLVHYAKVALEPAMNIKQAMLLFDETESDALAVVDGAATGKVIGLLTEAHALRRYTEELDRARRAVTGEPA